MSEKKILPCPWCGSDNVDAQDGVAYEQTALVHCRQCHRTVCAGTDDDTTDKAIAAWNTLAILRAERDAAVEAAYREGYVRGYADCELGHHEDDGGMWEGSRARKALGVDRG